MRLCHLYENAQSWRKRGFNTDTNAFICVHANVLMCVSAYLRCLWVAGVIYEGADLFGALILDE